MNIKLDKNDQLFSIMVRERDEYKCVFCGKSKEQGYTMQNSHFWGRGDKSNRFNPLNCDTLCFTCHNDNESNKQGFYRDWKIKQLGLDTYKELEILHNRGYKKYGKFEKNKLNSILKQQYENKEHFKEKWSVVW
jgi:hypothetical protein